MNIIFMGSPDFAVPSLEKLAKSGHSIRAVFTNKDKRRGRGASKSASPVKQKAIELGFPVEEFDDVKSDTFKQTVSKYNPDLIVVVAFKILPKEVLEIPAIGSINLHASLLPKYRGAAPIHWAVINGDKKTGNTVFFLDERVDTGNIIIQQEIEIGENETTGDVYKKLSTKGAELIVEAVNDIDKKSYNLKKQDHEKATPAPKIFKDDCRLDFNNSRKQIHNKIRGLSPFPTSWTTLNGEKFNIYRSSIPQEKNSGITGNHGALIVHNEELLVECNDGFVKLHEVQLPGTKKLSAGEFIHGYYKSGMSVL